MMSGIENRIPPPLLVLLIGGAMSTLLLDDRTADLPSAYRWGLTGLFFVMAGIFGFPAFRAFGRAKTTINPVAIDQASSLVTSGIYRLTRNPMYVALALLLCAWAAWLADPWALLGPVIFILFINRFQIIPEERALTAKFGEAYLNYRRATRRWL